MNSRFKRKAQDRIDAFIRGEMTPIQEYYFKNELKVNKELREMAISTAYLVKALNHMYNPKF